LSKDVDALQPHIRAFVERAVTFSSCPDCGGTRLSEAARSSKIDGVSIADACAMQIRHLGSSLTDVTYVFDEPTIGLHAHDVERMNSLLQRLRDKGNTVLVVEHDPEVIRIADHVVDMGPGAGPRGGTVVFEGAVEGL